MNLNAKTLVIFFSAFAFNGYARATPQGQDIEGKFYVEADAVYGQSSEPAVKSSVSMFTVLEVGGGYNFAVGPNNEVGLGVFGGKGSAIYNKYSDDAAYLVYLDLNYLTTFKGHYTYQISDKLAATAQAGLGTLRGEYRSDRTGKKVKTGTNGLTYSIDLGARINIRPDFDFLAGLSLWMINTVYNDVYDKRLYLNNSAFKIGMQYSL